MLIERRRQPGGRQLLAPTLSLRGEFGVDGRCWLDTQPAPPQEALEEQRIAELLAVARAYVDEHTVAPAAEEMIKQKLVLPGPREEVHRRPPGGKLIGGTHPPFDLMRQKGTPMRAPPTGTSVAKFRSTAPRSVTQVTKCREPSLGLRPTARSGKRGYNNNHAQVPLCRID